MTGSKFVLPLVTSYLRDLKDVMLSSCDAVVSPAEEGYGGGSAKETDNEEWPVSCLTTVTRQEFDPYKQENNPQDMQRRFTWGRKEGRIFLGDNREEFMSPI